VIFKGSDIGVPAGVHDFQFVSGSQNVPAHSFTTIHALCLDGKKALSGWYDPNPQVVRG
jgi:hypothetical protein